MFIPPNPVVPRKQFQITLPRHLEIHTRMFLCTLRTKTAASFHWPSVQCEFHTIIHYTTTLTTTTQLGYVLPVCSQLSLRNVRMCITVVLCPIHHRQMVCLCWLSGSVWHRVLASGGRAFCPQSCLSPEYSDSPGLPGALPDSVTSGGGLQNSGASAHSCVIARETHIYVCSVEGSRYVLFIVKCTVMFHASCRGAARPVRFLRKHGWHM